MGSLVFNFFKRSLLVPAAVTVATIALLMTLLNSAAAASQAKLTPQEPAKQELSGYSSSLYESFTDLKDGDLIGTIAGEEIGLYPTVVCYNLDNRLHVSMTEGSTAPWEGGAMLLIGTDNVAQLKALHNAKAGSTLTLEFTGKDTYTYTVEHIDACVTAAQLADYYTDGVMAVAIPYKNLSSVTADDCYLVFSAVQA